MLLHVDTATFRHAKSTANQGTEFAILLEMLLMVELLPHISSVVNLFVTGLIHVNIIVHS